MSLLSNYHSVVILYGFVDSFYCQILMIAKMIPPSVLMEHALTPPVLILATVM